MAAPGYESRQLTAKTSADVYLGEIVLAAGARHGPRRDDREGCLMAEKICTNIGHGGGPVLVHVEDDKIIRVRPLVFADDEAVPDLDARSARPAVLARSARTPSRPYGMTEKARTYADDRIKYPMKRVDWDPNGAPGSTGPGGRNNQNRGKSGYERIGWDEALEIVANEMKRVRETYGPEASPT